MVKQKLLTKKQGVTLRLLKMGYTVAEVAKHRKVSRQAVYKMLYWLEDKGIFNYSTLKRMLLSPKPSLLRLHALQYQIKILYQSPVYRKVQQQSNIITFGDFKIALHKASLTLWILRDFLGPKAEVCQSAASEYLYKTLAFVERKYNLTLVKRGYQNIKQVRHHYAKMQDPLAEKAIKENQPMQIRDRKDGKVWLSVDQSIKPPELETIHKESAFIDMHQVIEPFFNLLKEDPYFFNKLIDNAHNQQQAIKANGEHIEALTANLKGLIMAISSFFPKNQEPLRSAEPAEDQEPASYIG